MVADGNGKLLIHRGDTKHNCMTNEELRHFNLCYGINKAKFVVDCNKVKNFRISFNVFLYNEEDRIVLIDIDDTFTGRDIKVSIQSYKPNFVFHLLFQLP